MRELTDTGPQRYHPDFAAHWQATEAGAVVTVSGEVDLETAPELDTVLIVAAARTPDTLPLYLDLRAVTFLGSAGLSALIAGHQQCDLAGRKLVVVATHRAVLRSLRIAELDHVLTIVDELPWWPANSLSAAERSR